MSTSHGQRQRTLDLMRSRGTLASTDDFRLDKQNDINAHDVMWANLQVQHRNKTLYTIYVQMTPYLKGRISDRSVHNENIKSAHRGDTDVTLYYTKADPKAVKRVRRTRREIDRGDIELLLPVE